jgi:starch synthase
VTTAVGLVPDLLANGRDCLIVPMRDAAAIEAAVDRLIDDPALRQRLGSTARAAAERLRAPDRDQVVIDLLHAAAA